MTDPLSQALAAVRRLSDEGLDQLSEEIDKHRMQRRIEDDSYLDWHPISWTEYCIWVRGKTVSGEERKEQPRNPENGQTLITFTDGSQAKIWASYSAAWSDRTPGWFAGPAVEVREPT